jgi:hypothetical protein
MEKALTDVWPVIRVTQFSGESEREFRARAAEIIEIITGFRKSIFRGELGEEKEARLIELQEGLTRAPPKPSQRRHHGAKPRGLRQPRPGSQRVSARMRG